MSDKIAIVMVLAWLVSFLILKLCERGRENKRLTEKNDNLESKLSLYRDLNVGFQERLKKINCIAECFEKLNPQPSYPAEAVKGFCERIHKISDTIPKYPYIQAESINNFSKERAEQWVIER